MSSPQLDLSIAAGMEPTDGLPSPAQIALAIIAARKWRNGHLMELAAKGLAGETIARERDSDCTTKEWEILCKRDTSSSR